MPEKISIMRDSGETLNSNVVALFTIPDTGKQYIITTENAVDPHGLTVLHVSEIVDDKLKKIATDEEWSSIKTIMRSIISGNVGSYKFIPSITTAKADIQYSRDISVSAAASKQIIDSYLASNPTAPAEGGVVVEAKPVEDTNEITPGISEVVEEPAAQAAPVTDAVNVGNAVTNIPASAAISQPATPVPVEEKKEEVKEEVKAVEAQPVAVEETPKKEEAVQQEAAPVNVAPASVVNVQTPVVAYVDPAFQQLLTSDYNQILMHVQSINNNINQIAAMPALNYQPSYSANPNGTPNFNPNATVDEIIMGSTEVFNEGVKNLVATITEKIYRDLYQREAELAKREEVLLEREKMVNEQLAKLDAKVALKPAEPAPVAAVETVPAPVVEAPAQPVAEPAPAPAVEAPAPVVEAAPAPVQQPVVNVVEAPVKVEAAAPTPAPAPVVVEEVKVENTVPAQQNTAPVAEPAPVQAPVPPAAPAPEVGTPVVNTTPQPIQTVEIV